MIIRILTLFTLLVCASVHAQEQSFFCAYPAAKRASKIIKRDIAPMAYDKYVHCAVSCTVSVVCGAASATFVGVFKEIYDVFGPGNVELSDIAANIQGIGLSFEQGVNTLSMCKRGCQNKYPMYRYNHKYSKL